MSTMCITWPPSNFPSGFVCAGSTTSAISDADALTGLAFNSQPSTTSLFPLPFAFIALLIPAAFAARRSPRIIRKSLMTAQDKTRRQKLEEFIAQNPGDTFSRYGIALECLRDNDLAGAEVHFKALLQAN